MTLNDSVSGTTLPNNGDVSVAVSTEDCESSSMGSTPIRHPKFYECMSEWLSDCLQSNSSWFDST